MQYPTLPDTDRRFTRLLRISQFPTFLLVDPRTRIICYVAKGYGDELETELRNAIKAELKE